MKQYYIVEIHLPNDLSNFSFECYLYAYKIKNQENDETVKIELNLVLDIQQSVIKKINV